MKSIDQSINQFRARKLDCASGRCGNEMQPSAWGEGTGSVIPIRMGREFDIPVADLSVTRRVSPTNSYGAPSLLPVVDIAPATWSPSLVRFCLPWHSLCLGALGTLGTAAARFISLSTCCSKIPCHPTTCSSPPPPLPICSRRVAMPVVSCLYRKGWDVGSPWPMIIST